MNMNKKNSYTLRRAKHTLLGKVLCRLAGEETGQAMMEYVIVGTLIAAAVALAAWFFGRGIFDGFRKSDAAVRGDVQQAEQIDTTSKNERSGQGTAAGQSNRQFINHPSEQSATTDAL